MTGDQDPTDRWLTDQHANTRDGLNHFLDLDAGLREATLHGDHTNLQGSLSSKLDIETGLESALSGSPAPEPLSPAPQTESSQPDVVAAIKSIDPAVRMTLRRDPVIRAVILSHFLVRALDIVEKITARRSLDHANRDLARALALDLIRSHALPSALDPTRDRYLDPARTLILALDPDIAPALDHIQTRALTRTIARALARALDIAPAHELDSDTARELAQRMALAAGRFLGIHHVKRLVAALLDGALDDFTDADLTHADLSEADLTGVCWSVSGTRWPPGIDVKALQARSRKVASKTDIYVVEDDGKETLHHVQV